MKTKEQLEGMDIHDLRRLRERVEKQYVKLLDESIARGWGAMHVSEIYELPEAQEYRSRDEPLRNYREEVLSEIRRRKGFFIGSLKKRI